MPLDTSPAEFLLKNHLPADALETTGLKWNDLQAIYSDHEKNYESLDPHAQSLVQQLRLIPEVHSLRYRVKTPEHLIAKIIRKTIKRPDYGATLDAYKDIVTDRIGIRVLHLLKDEWLPIHRGIKDAWELKEKATVNLRHGDSKESFEQEDCVIHEHNAGYRSIHYVIESTLTKKRTFVELQVRTLCEETWGEIDHQISYPHGTNIVLKSVLAVFNRLVGLTDEMGTYVKFLQEELGTYENQIDEAKAKHEAIVLSMEKLIERSKLDAQEKAALERQVQELSASTKQVNMLSDSLFQGTIGVGPRFARTIADYGSPTIHLWGIKKCDQCGTVLSPGSTEAKCFFCKAGVVNSGWPTSTFPKE